MQVFCCSPCWITIYWYKKLFQPGIITQRSVIKLLQLSVCLDKLGGFVRIDFGCMCEVHAPYRPVLLLHCVLHFRLLSCSTPETLVQVSTSGHI